MRAFSYHERQFIKALDDECVRFLMGSWALALHGVSVNPRDLDVLIGIEADPVATPDLHESPSAPEWQMRRGASMRVQLVALTFAFLSASAR